VERTARFVLLDARQRRAFIQRQRKLVTPTFHAAKRCANFHRMAELVAMGQFVLFLRPSSPIGS